MHISCVLKRSLIFNGVYTSKISVDRDIVTNWLIEPISNYIAAHEGFRSKITFVSEVRISAHSNEFNSYVRNNLDSKIENLNAF